MQTLTLDFIRDDATVRITDGTPPLISVIDIVRIVTENNNDYSAQIIRNMNNNHSDVMSSCQTFKFPGKGQRNTPVADFQTILKILQHLPGPSAAKYREKTAETLTRYFAGDQSLHQEIDRNLQSNNPINQIARESMLNPTDLEDTMLAAKRQKIVHLQLDEEITDAEIRISQKKKQLEDINNQRIISFKETLERHFPEDNATMMNCMKNALCSQFLTNHKLQITSGDTGSQPSQVQSCLEETMPVTISQCAIESNFNLTTPQLAQVGKIVARLYREKHNKEPKKTQTIVNHQVVNVNAYTRVDIPLIQEALEQFRQELEQGFLHKQTSIHQYIPYTTSD